jgi:hypothetical protein
MVVTGVFGERCALCWEAFRIGDAYTSIWRKGGRPVGERGLSINVHPRCLGQLDPGDLTRIFAALERRLAHPLAVLNGRVGSRQK